ncbi:MAG: nucleotidyltransferase domain-containing protein [Bacteroidales bacterium]|nr:nucleotidyltransferase domain-containing protein [Bacteroidales bacterium]
MNKQLVEVISRFVNLNHIDGIILTGSYAENRALANSDVDVILVSKLTNRVIYETVVYNEKKYQLLFFPYFKVPLILMENALKGEGIYISMFKKGIIILDDSNSLLKRLKTFAMHAGSCISEHEILNLQNFITKNLEDLQVASTEEEKLFCAVDILKHTTQLLSGRMQLSTGKHLGRAVNDSETTLKQLVDAFNMFIKTKDVSHFTSTTNKLLAHFGNATTKHTSDYVWLVPPERQVMVFFPNHTIYQNEVFKIITNITSLCSDCSCHNFYIGKNQLMEAGVYLAVYSELQESKSILERINEYRKTITENNIRKDIRMSFPYKTLYFEGLYFGGEEILKKLLPYYESISSFIFKTIVEDDADDKRNILLLLATDFLLQFVKTIFNTETDRHKFLSDYCESLLPEVIDPNALYNINQLPDIKEVTISYYESVFVKNKSQLLKLSTKDSLANIANYELLQKLYSEISDVIININCEQQILNPIWNTKETKQILKTNITNHILSLFHLNPIEKFSIAYNVEKTLKLNY